MDTSPASGVTEPAMTLNSVDLPAPLDPTTQANSPAPMDRSTPSSARWATLVPGLKVFSTPRTSSMAMSLASLEGLGVLGEQPLHGALGLDAYGALAQGGPHRGTAMKAPTMTAETSLSALASMRFTDSASWMMRR